MGTPNLTPTQTPTPSGSSAHRGFERFTFDFYDVERSLSVEIARVILHTILFQRAMGHVRPGSILLLEQEFPCVRDPSLERVVEGKLAEVKSQIKGDTAQGVRLKIALLQTPSPSSTSASSTQQKEQQLKHSSSAAAAATTASTSPADTQQTATRAGGYPYAWIAHAWSGGITGTTAHRPEESGGTNPSPSPSPAAAVAPATDTASAAARTSLEPDRFEEWVVSISLASSNESRTERERNRLTQTSSDQLKEFVRQVIRFTDEKRLHIPSITTNELEPFPIKIDIEPLS